MFDKILEDVDMSTFRLLTFFFVAGKGRGKSGERASQQQEDLAGPQSKTTNLSASQATKERRCCRYQSWFFKNSSSFRNPPFLKWPLRPV